MGRFSLMAALLLGLLGLPALAQRAPLNSDPGNAPGVVNVNEAPRESLLLLYRTAVPPSGREAERLGRAGPPGKPQMVSSS